MCQSGQREMVGGRGGDRHRGGAGDSADCVCSRDSLAPRREQDRGGDERVDAGVTAAEGVVDRQYRLGIAANEVNRAGVAYGGVTVGIERGDGSAEGVASNTTRWSADGVVRRWGRDDAYRGVAGNRAGDRID